MGALTKQEREGLEDIFLSINTNDKIKNISSMIVSKNISLNTIKLLQVAKIGLKETKLSRFITFFLKKKKNLSK